MRIKGKNTLLILISFISISLIYIVMYVTFNFFVLHLLLIISSIVLLFFVHTISHLNNPDKILIHFGAMFPRLFMVIIAGWTLLVTTDELVSTSVFSHIADNFIYNLGAIYVLIIFIMIEVKNLGLRGKNINLFSRSLGVLLVGFIYSVLIGVIAINMVIPSMLDKFSPLENALAKYYANPDISQIDFSPVGYSLTYNSDYWKFLQEKENPITNTYYTCSTDKVSENINIVYSGNKIQIVRTDSLLKRIMVDQTLTKEKFELLSNIEIHSKFYYDIPFLELQKSHKWCYVVSVSFYKLIIIPGLLFSRLFFILFAAICLQLIFEEKPMTEPL